MIPRYQPDGLPNITGSIGFKAETVNPQGAFYTVTNNTYPEYSSGNNYGDIVGFNASNSNPIYGKSNYVTPKNVNVLPILKY